MGVVRAEACVVALSGEGSFEERLKAATGEAASQLTGRGLPPGSPAAILVSSAAMGAVSLIKFLPGLNKVRLPHFTQNSCLASS